MSSELDCAMTEATKAIGVACRDGARLNFNHCNLKIHSGNNVRESGAKPKQQRPTNSQTTLSNDLNEMIEDNRMHPENDEEENMPMDLDVREHELSISHCKKDSPPTEHTLQNDVLIHKRNATILSVLYTNDKNLKEGTDFLKKNYTRIISLPGQVVASAESTMKLTMQCKIPPGMRITPKNKACKITRVLLRKKWHNLQFKPELNPNKHSGEYKVRYAATVRNLDNQRTDGGFSEELAFRWPLVPQYQGRNDEEQEPSTGKHIHLSNLCAGGIVFIGHGPQPNADPETRLKSSRHVEVSSEQDRDYVNLTKTSLQQTLNQKDVKVQIVGPEGDSVELEKCCVEIHPAEVSEEKEVEVSLDINPDHFPDSVGLVPISHILKCKPSVFEHPVRVRLKSFLIPKSGKELRFTILSKTGEGEWKPILEGTVVKSVIEYEVEHFCSHVAVVSEEDEENGEYHLFNDVWMHIKSGRVLSIFCKDESALKKASKVLEVEHERILPLPEEVFVSIGNTIEVEIQCNSPPGMRMASIDGSNGRFKIGRDMSRMNFFAMFFRLEPHPDKIRSTEPYEVDYHATILDAGGHVVEGGFSCPLDFDWPVLQSDEPNRDVTPPDERQNAEASLTEKRPIKTQGRKRGSDRSFTELQFKGESSQDNPQPSDESASILTEEDSTETLRKAADSLFIEKKTDTLGSVQSTKNTDRDKASSTFSSTTIVAAEIMQIEMPPVPAVTREKTKLYPHEGESSQDCPQPSDESASILMEENSETLRQAADCLSIEKKIESSGIVQSTKITDREKDNESQVYRFWIVVSVYAGQLSTDFCTDKRSFEYRSTNSQTIRILATRRPVVVSVGDVITTKFCEGKTLLDSRSLKISHEDMKDKFWFWPETDIPIRRAIRSILHPRYTLEILRSKTGVIEEAFSFPIERNLLVADEPLCDEDEQSSDADESMSAEDPWMRAVRVSGGPFSPIETTEIKVPRGKDNESQVYRLWIVVSVLAERLHTWLCADKQSLGVRSRSRKSIFATPLPVFVSVGDVITTKFCEGKTLSDSRSLKITHEDMKDKSWIGHQTTNIPIGPAILWSHPRSTVEILRSKTGVTEEALSFPIERIVVDKMSWMSDDSDEDEQSSDADESMSAEGPWMRALELRSLKKVPVNKVAIEGTMNRIDPEKRKTIFLQPGSSKLESSITTDQAAERHQIRVHSFDQFSKDIPDSTK